MFIGVLWVSKQWGLVTSTASSLTFPIPFTTQNYSFCATPTSDAISGGINLYGIKSTNNLSLRMQLSNDGTIHHSWNISSRQYNPCWFAAGY